MHLKVQTLHHTLFLITPTESHRYSELKRTVGMNIFYGTSRWEIIIKLRSQKQTEMCTKRHLNTNASKHRPLSTRTNRIALRIKGSALKNIICTR